MTEEDQKELILMNNRLCLLLGYASGLLMNVECYTDKKQHEWFNEAINNLFYLDKPLPPMPS